MCPEQSVSYVSISTKNPPCAGFFVFRVLGMDFGSLSRVVGHVMRFDKFVGSEFERPRETRATSKRRSTGMCGVILPGASYKKKRSFFLGPFLLPVFFFTPESRHSSKLSLQAVDDPKQSYLRSKAWKDEKCHSENSLC